MARVILSSEVADRFTGRVKEFDMDADNMRSLMRALDAQYEGLRAFLEEHMFVSIDGEMIQDPFLEPLEPTSEVCFLPKLKGG